MPRPRPKRLPFAELFFQPHAHDDHSNTHTPNKKGGLIGRDVPPPYGSIAAELDMETKDADDVFDLFNEKEVQLPSPRSTRPSSSRPKPEKKRSHGSGPSKENDYPPPESRYANPQSSPETGPQYPHPYHPYPSPSEHGPHPGPHPYSQGYYPPGHTQILSSPYHQQYPQPGGMPPYAYGFQPSPHEGYYPGYHRPPFGGPAAPYGGNYLWSPQSQAEGRDRDPKREETRSQPHFRERTKTPPLPPKELKSPPPTPRADNMTPGRKRTPNPMLGLASPPKKRPSLTATHPPIFDRNQLTPERSPPTFGVSLSRDSRDDGGFQPVDTPLLYNNYFGSMGDVDTPGNLSAGGLPEVRGTSSSAMLTFSPVGGTLFGNEELTPYRDGAATHPTRKKREFPESPFSMFTGGQLSPLKQPEEFDERGASRYPTQHKGPPPSLINSMDKNYKGRRITPRSDKSQGRYDRGPSLRRLDDPITPHREPHRAGLHDREREHARDGSRDHRSKPEDTPNSNTFDGRNSNASIILKIGNMGGLQRQNMDGINSVLRGSPVKPSRQSGMTMSLSSSNHSRDRLGHTDRDRHGHPNTIMSSSHTTASISTPAKDRDRTPSFRPQRSPMGHANVHTHNTSSTPQYRHAVTPFPPLTTPSSQSSSSKTPKGSGNEEDKGKSHRRNPCNCKRSKCLKLYCECFAAERYCDGCNCQDCNNIEQFEHLRADAIKATRAKNPNAFKPRFDAKNTLGLNTPTSSRAGHLLSQTPSHNPAADTGHNMGCRCKKSACLKKYCECFEAGYMCGEKCKCVDCQNYIGSQQLIDRRRKIKDHKGAEMAMRSADDAWKNRRRKEEPRVRAPEPPPPKVAATPQPRHPMYRARPSPSGSPYGSAPGMMMHPMTSPPGYSPSPHLMHHPSQHLPHAHPHHTVPPYHHSQYPPSSHPPNRQVTPGYHPSRYPNRPSISPYSQTRRPHHTPLSGGRTASAVKRLGFDAYSSKKHRRVSKPGEERTTAVFGHRVAPQPKTTALSIFSFLNNDELYNACLVSKQWTSLSLDEELWQF